MVIHGIFLRSVQIKQTERYWCTMECFNWIVNKVLPRHNGEILRIFHGHFPLSQPHGPPGYWVEHHCHVQKQRFFWSEQEPIAIKQWWWKICFQTLPNNEFWGGQKSAHPVFEPQLAGHIIYHQKKETTGQPRYAQTLVDPEGFRCRKVGLGFHHAIWSPACSTVSWGRKVEFWMARGRAELKVEVTHFVQHDYNGLLENNIHTVSVV